MEIIDLGALEHLEPVSLNLNTDTLTPPPPPPPGSKSSGVNFGGGIELLMNDKKRSNSNASAIDLGDLNKLENELNQATTPNSSSTTTSSSSSGDTKTLKGMASSFLGFGSTTTAPPIDIPTDSKIGQATSESMGNTKTWDGYAKMNEIPMSAGTGPVKMSERDRRRKKRAMIKKIEEWYEKGHTKQHSHFTIESPYEEVEDEYETLLEEKRKKDSVKLQGWWFMTFINSVEYANTVFNPFDLNLDGWGEQVSEDLESYEDIFTELHDKYKGGKLAPELSLLLRIGFSACVVNFTNKALSTATPGFNDVIKQSPELMKMFTNATVNSMSQQSPGFAFANNLMQEQENKPRGPPPPAPLETKNMAGPPRPGMAYTDPTAPPSNRPDINAGRGAMFREKGIEVNGYANTMRTNNGFIGEQQQQTSRPRTEMRGPQNSDIDNILSGLKTRAVNIQEQQQTNVSQEDDSMISISSMKDLQDGNMPKRSRRRNGSNKNTISLDI
uniref:Uncharacterized protein n=1 Tax=viral metagenome TaxID=1070528 RepID=A0A6C0I377_9ZZZZ